MATTYITAINSDAICDHCKEIASADYLQDTAFKEPFYSLRIIETLFTVSPCDHAPDGYLEVHDVVGITQDGCLLRTSFENLTQLTGCCYHANQLLENGVQVLSFGNGKVSRRK